MQSGYYEKVILYDFKVSFNNNYAGFDFVTEHITVWAIVINVKKVEEH